MNAVKGTLIDPKGSLRYVVFWQGQKAEVVGWYPSWNVVPTNRPILYGSDLQDITTALRDQHRLLDLAVTGFRQLDHKVIVPRDIAEVCAAAEKRLRTTAVDRVTVANDMIADLRELVRQAVIGQ
ncbi:hypothetical protein GCM10010123_45820 [Pilimelia anulata]|uniref:Uncharacterized protein n=1 Tax=Pilimelia anulata TaxID=53371 RepID=A0A8J3FEY7_9ACTN|nr:hypothetical protein [Pilimelia anulata]GGK10654.1 hypothetical protein GCM10010123_45820 [Pilimelia anulata]